MIQEGFTEEVSFALGFEGQPRAQCFRIGRKQKKKQRKSGPSNGQAKLLAKEEEMKARTLSLESLLYMDVGGGADGGTQ